MDRNNSHCNGDSCQCGSGNQEAVGSGQLPWENGNSFHPMGDDWEDEMEKMLDDTEYDTELGMQMAEDAMKLVAGELTEEEFYDEYHNAVIEEFGTDERPMAELIENSSSASERLIEGLKNIEAEDVSRRETMKKMGFGAGAVGLGSGLLGREDTGGAEPVQQSEDAISSIDETEGDGKQYGMVVDLDRCDGCLLCVAGCLDENNWSSGANWMYVLTYEDEKTDEENFLVRPCQHCTNAPCAKVCPVRARHRRKDGGLVLTDYETCIGCRYCQVACPYGVNYFQWGEPDTPEEELSSVDITADDLRDMPADERREVLAENMDHVHDKRGRKVDSRPPKGVMGKCTFCPSRQDGNMGEEQVGTVACQDACDAAGMSVIHFGDLNDPDSRPNRYLERRKEVEPRADEKFEEPYDEEWEDIVTERPESQLSAFRLLEEMGTQPNIFYLGNEPGPDAEQVEGPVTYESLGFEDRRKDHLDQSTIGIAPRSEGD